MIRKLKYGFILLALALASSCSQDDALTDDGGQDAPAATGETKQQKVRLLITTAPQEDIDGGTRAVPPGYEGSTMTESFDECRVTEVALFVFKRKAGSSDEFVFDAANPAVVTFDGEGKINGKGLTDIKPYSDVEGDPDFDADKASRNMKYVEGTITKEKDYEYRVFALGYNTKRTDEHPSAQGEFDEREDFRIVDGNGNGISETTTLSEVKLKLVQRKYSDLVEWLAHREYRGFNQLKKINQNITGWWVRTPEIYYGECFSAGKTDNIIRFEDDNKLTGVMRRGVAKVTVNLSDVGGAVNDRTRHLCKFSLLIDQLPTEVYLDSYDRFNTPGGIVEEPLKNELKETYWPGNPEYYEYGSDANSSNFKIYTATTGEDECLKDYDNDEEKVLPLSFYVLPTKTQMRARYSTSNHITPGAWEAYIAVKSLSNGNQATGVIDPSSSGKYFYFRRNQLYVINGTGGNIKDTDDD